MVATWGQRTLAGRRALFAGVASTVIARSVRAEGPNVPIRLQAELLAKIAGYDRHFAARAGERAAVLIAVVPRDSDSRLAATDMRNALAALPSVGGMPHEEEVIHYADAVSLAEMCRARRAAVLYLTPGLSQDIPAIRDALSAFDLLTVASIADYVPAGAVLGFDLVSGRPKLLVNLTQARKQHVDFRAEVLKLTRVFE